MLSAGSVVLIGRGSGMGGGADGVGVGMTAEGNRCRGDVRVRGGAEGAGMGPIVSKNLPLRKWSLSGIFTQVNHLCREDCVSGQAGTNLRKFIWATSLDVSEVWAIPLTQVRLVRGQLRVNKHDKGMDKCPSWTGPNVV